MPTGHASLMPALRRAVLAATADHTDGQLLGAFVLERDGEAFGQLVRRHGPMVLGVCRRVIADHASAEDAFQAVFLVLARRAAAVRPREQVGNWLYGVAYRTALKARAVLARRRSREKQVDAMPEPPAHTPPDDWADLRPVIDEELARLPEKLRTPVVLCDLEGRPQREVAKHLGVAPATLAARLASARRTLAQRLTRRGVALSGGAVAALLTAHGAAVAVPPVLVSGLSRAAEAVAAGGVCSGLVSASAVQLSEGVMRMMLLTKLKSVAVVALTAAALTGGLGLGLIPAGAATPGDDPAPRPAPARAAKAAPPADPLDKPAEKIDKLVELAWATDPKVADEVFLRRLSLDLRGVPPTDIETFFFVADGDENKRDKVIDWMLDDGAVRAFAAKRVGAANRAVRVVRAPARGGKPGTIILLVQPADEAKPDAPQVKFTIADAADTLWLVGGAGDDGNTRVRVWDVADGTRAGFARLGQDHFWVDVAESDLDFLKRVTSAARGTPPTALEEKYFTEDKDPKKREKLLDTLLKEPAVAKKLGDDFRKRMLAAPAVPDVPGAPAPGQMKFLVVPGDGKDGQKFEFKLPEGFPSNPKDGQKFELRLDPKLIPFLPKDGLFEFKLDPKNLPFVPQGVPFKFEIELGPDGKPVPPKAPVPPVPPIPPQPGVKVLPPLPPQPPAPPQPVGDKLGKLVDELLAAKKSDAEMLEALTLATAGRLPTDVEKRLTLGLVAKTADRRSAWVEVAKAMAGPVAEVKAIKP